MGALTVLNPGMLTTVQDLGRPGYASIGVPQGGAADPLALRVGNRLLGNPEGAAALELTLVGGTYAFATDGVIALAGAEANTVLESGGKTSPVPSCAAIHVRAGDRLRVGPITRGARTYLCIRGGVRVEPVLGSSSTFLGAGFGGLQGRPLRHDDRVEWGGAQGAQPALSPVVARALVENVLARRRLRAVAGSHAGSFTDDEVSAFWSRMFTVSPRSDRVGVRLSGHIGAERGAATGRMVSEGMMCGAVQVPPSGEPIALLADHPTTGGYPVIACIATVDLPVLGQLRPGDAVGFECVSQAAALELLRERERQLAEAAAA